MSARDELIERIVECIEREEIEAAGITTGFIQRAVEKAVDAAIDMCAELAERGVPVRGNITGRCVGTATCAPIASALRALKEQG